MKILIRRLFDCPPVDRWRKFEGLMVQYLEQAGHEVVQDDLSERFPSDPPDAAFKIYAHKNRNEVPWNVDLFYKEMHMKGLFTIDHMGWGSAHSASSALPDLSSVDKNEAIAFCEAWQQQFLSRGLSKHIQPEIKPIPDRYKPYIFVPLQLPTDDTIKHHSPVGLSQFINIMGKWARRRKVNLIFKKHPCREFPHVSEAVARNVASSSHIHSLDENVHALITGARGVCVINSGVGFESLIHGKPVITFGRSDYHWATFRAGEHNLDDAMEYASAYTEEEIIRGYRFIYHYFRKHAYDTDDAVLEETRSRLFTYLSRFVTAEVASSLT